MAILLVTTTALGYIWATNSIIENSYWLFIKQSGSIAVYDACKAYLTIEYRSLCIFTWLKAAHSPIKRSVENQK